MVYSQEENLLIQSYMNVAFITELNRLKFLDSDWYKGANFQDNYVHEKFPSIGIDNQGMILIFLYAMLVLPKELIQDSFPDEFKAVGKTVEDIKSFSESTYDSDSDGIDYVRHIRNAVSHGRVVFTDTNEVEFNDEYNKQKCTIRVPLNQISQILFSLQKLYVKYIDRLITTHASTN